MHGLTFLMWKLNGRYRSAKNYILPNSNINSTVWTEFQRAIKCKNDNKELQSAELWNRKVNRECSDLANEQNLNNVTSCTFETQYAGFIRYPIMFTGALQDTIFMERHTCFRPWTTIPSDRVYRSSVQSRIGNLNFGKTFFFKNMDFEQK